MYTLNRDAKTGQIKKAGQIYFILYIYFIMKDWNRFQLKKCVEKIEYDSSPFLSGIFVVEKLAFLSQ